MSLPVAPVLPTPAPMAAVSTAGLLPAIDDTQDRDQAVINAPSYAYQRFLQANANGSTVTLSRTAQTEVYFDIPANNVMNLKKSYIVGQLVDSKDTTGGQVANWQADRVII